MNTENCKCVQQGFWAAVIDFVVPRLCSTTLPIIFIISLECCFTSLSFVLSSMAHVREQQEQGCASREAKLGAKGDDSHQQWPHWLGYSSTISEQHRQNKESINSLKGSEVMNRVHGPPSGRR